MHYVVGIYNGPGAMSKKLVLLGMTAAGMSLHFALVLAQASATKHVHTALGRSLRLGLKESF